MIAAIREQRTAVSSAPIPDDNMQREDTDPWYRQFWPWFIIALPASAVVAGLYTLWLAGQTTDSLVIHSDDGVNVVAERNDAAEKAAAELGLTATVNLRADTGAVVVTLPAGLPDDFSPPLELRLQHPTLAARDAVVELQAAVANADGEPTWIGYFTAPPVGRYYVILSAGDAWRLSGTWSGETTLALASTDSTGNGSP
jgi:uncharacterized protein